MPTRDEYDEVFHSLSRLELQKGAADLDLPSLFGDAGDGLWLGFYTEEGLWDGLDRYGLWDLFAEIGYPTTRLEIQADDPDEHLLRIWSTASGSEHEPLLELVARRDVIVPADELSDRLGRDPIGVLNIEWLQLQRPDGEFSEARPPLPGQRHPGLGIGREILELLRQATKRLGLEGLVTVPSYFHNAYFYSAEFQYMDPREHGLFLSLCRDVLPRTYASVAAGSWAITQKMVVEASHDDKPFEWFHDVMLAPISPRLRAYAGTAEYQREVCEALTQYSFRVFEEALRQDLESRGIRPFDSAKIGGWIGERV